MGRARKPLQMQQDARQWVAFFWHPLTKKTKYAALGLNAGEAEKKLEHLNRVFLNPELWRALPSDFPPDLKDLWEGTEGRIRIAGGVVKQGGQTFEAGVAELAAAKADAAHYKALYEASVDYCKKIEKELTHWRGRKLNIGAPSKTLEESRVEWVKGFKGKDSEHTKIVCYDLARFVDHFGKKTNTDDMAGREREIDVWLKSLTTGKVPRPISAGRRAQIRRHVLRFLEDSGCPLLRKQVTTVKRKEIRRDRGAIRWLDAEQAKAISAALAAPWRDVFDIQCNIGLRPSEVPTLKRGDFATDFKTLTLSAVPRTELTLKTGPRTIAIHRFPDVVPLLQALHDAADDLLFTENGKPWNLSHFMKQFRTALKAAATAAGVKTPKTDARIGRRTCASILLRAGRSIEQAAALLGDDPNTIREHYSKILPEEV